MGGKPKTSTPADKRLAANKLKTASTAKVTKATMPSGATFGRKGSK